ncbi:MAG: portal protein [Actinobacteria bacterium]|uniref:Unannotated protein n=1 Tax=freshwater metagenome TaxID=449393 RepID=A0A6J7JWH1_9ZZZZ|nr:portal protein [Actinomycetota bacterium]
MRIVVIGHTDVGRRACGALQARGVSTVHLDDPSDAEVRDALAGDVDGVAVLLHDDIRALRYCLVVEHARRGIRLFVAMFDRTARTQIEAAIENCLVLSPAAISVPSIVAAAIAPDHHAVRRELASTEQRWVSISSAPASAASEGESQIVRPYSVPSRVRFRGLMGRLAGQFRPYDSGSAVLVGGAVGLLVVLLIDTLIGLRHHSLVRSLYDAARTTSTIGAPELADETWTLLWATLAALLVMGLTAAFSAGIVQHLLSGRHVSIVGRRVVPRRGHVVISGMGQVGVRAAQELRDLGVAVVGIERFPGAPGLALARDLGIAVIVGDATSRRVLRRAGLGHAAAVVAAGSDERDNIAVAVSARALREDIPVVLRAGADDAIDETRSLFHIGSVVDVNGLTAAFVVQSMTSEAPYAVFSREGEVVAVDAKGVALSVWPAAAARCAC